MVAVKEHRTAIQNLAPIAVDLVTQMVDQKISVDLTGKRDQRRDHLHPGPHSIDQISPRVEPEIRLEDIISHHGEPCIREIRPDVGAEDTPSGRRDHQGRIRIVADTHFHNPAVAAGNILPDAPFNMFMVTHSLEIRE